MRSQQLPFYIGHFIFQTDKTQLIAAYELIPYPKGVAAKQ